MNLLIKNGRVIDPANKIDDHLDILIQGSKITAIAHNIVGGQNFEPLQIIDVSNNIVVPGLIDVHVHLREPGEPHKETIYTGSRAAAAGGFTTIICQPNTNPRLDSPEAVKLIIEQAKKDSVVHLYPSACITKRPDKASDLPGNTKLANIKALKEAGAVKLTDDGDPVIENDLMEKALEASKKYNIVISPHCELSPWAERYYLNSLNRLNSYTMEPVFIKRDIEMAKKLDAPLFISHVSMEETINEIARAKHEGVPITCEVTPHHLLLTEDAKDLYGTNAKVNPPLRSRQDVTAMIDALRDGTIDVIASDHAPHGVKSDKWEEAEFGIIGLETTLGLVLTKLVGTGCQPSLPLQDAIAKMTINPAKIFNLPAGQLKVGMPADITIIDLNKEWTVDVTKFKSKSRNCPFNGWKLKGKAIMTIVGGKIITV